MKYIIKICGMRESDNIRAVEALHPDWMGFIFWPKSDRNVCRRPAYLPTRCKRVGVFVDEDIAKVKCTVDDFSLGIIQLHGHESPDYIRRLCAVCGDAVVIVKAFNIATAADFAQTKPYEGLADYFLFDTKGKSVGGNGEKFEWSVLTAYDGDTPFLLSGGIGPDDAPRLHQVLELVEKCKGIDLNSRFEIAPGLKNVAALRQFLNEFNHEST